MGPENNGTLTIPANIVGIRISIPAGTIRRRLPVGMQVIGHHHADALLLDLALVVEQARGRSWPRRHQSDQASPPAGPHRATGEVPALCVRER